MAVCFGLGPGPLFHPRLAWHSCLQCLTVWNNPSQGQIVHHNFRRDKNKWHYETLHHSAPLAREMGFGLKTACLGISPCLLDLLAPPAGRVCLQQLLFVLYLLKKVEILYIIRIRHLHKWMRPVWFCLLILNPMWQVSWCEAFFPWNCRSCCLLFWQEFAYRREWRLSPKIYHPCYTSV